MQVSKNQDDILKNMVALGRGQFPYRLNLNNIERYMSSVRDPDQGLYTFIYRQGLYTCVNLYIVYTFNVTGV